MDEAVFGQGDADAATVVSRDWLIQVGAFSRQTLAMSRIRQLQDTVLAVHEEAGREVNIAERGGENVFRARFTALTEAEAGEACAALIAGGSDCFAMRANP